MGNLCIQLYIGSETAKKHMLHEEILGIHGTSIAEFSWSVYVLWIQRVVVRWVMAIGDDGAVASFDRREETGTPRCTMSCFACGVGKPLLVTDTSVGQGKAYLVLHRPPARRVHSIQS